MQDLGVARGPQQKGPVQFQHGCVHVKSNLPCPTLGQHLQRARLCTPLDGPAIRNANRGDSRESIRRETTISQRASDSRESPQTCDSQAFSRPKRDSRKRNPETTDSRESAIRGVLLVKQGQFTKIPPSGKITGFCELFRMQRSTPFSRTGSRFGHVLVWLAWQAPYRAKVWAHYKKLSQN